MPNYQTIINSAWDRDELTCLPFLSGDVLDLGRPCLSLPCVPVSYIFAVDCPIASEVAVSSPCLIELMGGD